MVLTSLSSIEGWLYLDLSRAGNISPCQFVDFGPNASLPTLTNASCAKVCNDSESLFWPGTSNLLTCGTWTTTISEFAEVLSTNSHSVDETFADNLFNGFQGVNQTVAGVFDQFRAVGLDASVLPYAQSYANTISSCFLETFIGVNAWSEYDDDNILPSRCRMDSIFPSLALHPQLGEDPRVTNQTFDISIDLALRSLRKCLTTLCSPRTLNPDIAGIGVFSSFIMQSTIAMVAFIALIGIDLWRPSDPQKRKAHMGSLVTALVDFHKSQCYFSSTLSLTTIILVRGIEGKGRMKDSLDLGTFLIIATGGLIPVQLTLTCITRYGRQSWYLIILSLVTTVLASVTLSLYYSSIDLLIAPIRKPIAPPWQCTIHASIPDYLSPICGSNSPHKSYFSGTAVTNYWIWLVWVNSVAWLMFCIVRRACASQRLRYHTERISLDFGRFSTIIETRHQFPWSVFRSQHAYLIRTGIFAGIWLLTFASQFYLFTIYFRHALISPRWTLGQVIAVTVWVPAVVEYIYIECNGTERASKYRYPSPLKVMEFVARQTLDIAVRGLASDQAERAPSPRPDANGAIALRSDSSPASHDAGLELQDLEAGRSETA